MSAPTKFMREICALIRADGRSITDISREAGVCRNCLYRWEKGRAPLIVDVVAVLNAIGMTIAVRQVNDAD